MSTKKRHKRGRRILAGILVAVLLYSLISLVVTKFIYDSQFPRYDRHDETVMAGLRYTDLAETYPRQLFQFKSGDNQLQGYLYGQDQDRGLVVVAHGIGSGADSYLPQITWFVDQGWRVLAFDATGSFDSEGATTRGFPQALLDLDALLTYISTQEEESNLPLLLFGHSWGGYAVTNILHFNHDIQGVVSVAGVNSSMEMVLEQGQRMMGPFIYLQYPFLWLYQRFLFGSVASLSADVAIRSTDVPVMLIHGSEDEMVSFSGSSIVAAVRQDTPSNVHLLIRDQKDRNGHNNLFRSTDALAYIEDINHDYRKLYEQYEQNIPYDVRQDFYAMIDRARAQQLDEGIMGDIQSFYLDCLSSR
ncbi:MAG: alpha/beta hydrolase [Ruminococcaceae bacterium]|nr:alpha/beta hydrolase [Oscillospiraceae bacterium]